MTEVQDSSLVVWLEPWDLVHQHFLNQIRKMWRREARDPHRMPRSMQSAALRSSLGSPISVLASRMRYHYHPFYLHYQPSELSSRLSRELALSLICPAGWILPFKSVAFMATYFVTPCTHVSWPKIFLTLLPTAFKAPYRRCIQLDAWLFHCWLQMCNVSNSLTIRPSWRPFSTMCPYEGLYFW